MKGWLMLSVVFHCSLLLLGRNILLAILKTGPNVGVA